MALGAAFLTYMLLAGPALPQAPSPVPRATLAEVAFIAGHWRNESAEGLSEEVWTAPGEAVFEGRSTSGGSLRLTYRKQGQDGLEVTLEKDGEKPQIFPLRRAAAPR